MRSGYQFLGRAAVLAAFWGWQAAPAAVLNWTGTAGSNWTESANWSVAAGSDEDGIPDADDDVVLPDGPPYAGGVCLNGNQTCNSLTISNLTAFTLGGPGQTLILATGALNRFGAGATQHRFTCDLDLQSPDGTNTWNVSGGETYLAATQEVLIEGQITAAGRLRKIGGAGKLTLANTNSFGGPPLVEAGILEVKGVLVSEALGSGLLALAPASKLYVRDRSQVLTNPLTVTAAGIAPLIGSFNCTLTLVGPVDVPSGRSFQFGQSGSTLIVLSNTVTGAGSLATSRNGTAFSTTNQFAPGNLNIGLSGGSVILDGLSWTAFTNFYSNGYGVGTNRQWRLGGGGLGARTSPLVIAGSGAVGGGADAKTWFDRAVGVGGYYDATTLAYANSRVIVEVNTELSARQDWQSGTARPLVSGTHDDTVTTWWRGNISDQVAAGTGVSRGSPRFNQGVSGETVLSGTNDWTGSQYMSGLAGPKDTGGMNSLNTGRGGLLAVNNVGLIALVRFEGPQSLPRGNGGLPAWIAGVSRYNGSVGFLFTAKPGGEAYALPPGYGLLLGTAPTGVLGASGEAGTAATLRGSAVCIHNGLSTAAQTLDLLVRGPCEFILGEDGVGTEGATVFQPTWDLDGDFVDYGVNSATCTVVQTSGAPRTLRTRGDGTVVLRHVAYKQADGTGDTHSQFTWQLGLASGLNYFDGAVRETGDALENSTAAFPLHILGGVLELGSSDFTRAVSNAPAAGEVRFFYGGGFSAHGGDRRVNLGGGALFDWGNTGAGYTHGNYPLVFGSRTANATLIFENDVNLGVSVQRVLATVRGTGTTPEGRITGQVRGSGAGLNVTGLLTRANEVIPAGTLELAHTNNTFTGPVNIGRGTLLVNGGIRAGTNAVTVFGGGTLGGTGVVVRPVTVASNGTLMAGGAGVVGTLTLTNRVTLSEGAVVRCGVASGRAGLIKVDGALTLPTNATVTVTNLTGGPVPERVVLFQAAAPPAGATDLRGWTVNSAPPSAYVMISGSAVVLRTPRGTLVTVR